MTFQAITEYVSEPSPVNIVTASAAATSVFWLEWLRSISEVAAVLLPILGVAWLGMQMFVFIRKNYR